MMYDVALVIESVWAFNPDDAKQKAIDGINNSKIRKSDVTAFCHQIGGKRKRV